MAFCTNNNSGVLFHTSSVLEHTTIVHGFSTRIGGRSEGHFASLNLRMGGAEMDNTENIRENYRRICAAVGADVNGIVTAGQVHEDTVRVVTRADAGKGVFVQRDYTADALVTHEPGLSLVVFSADCGIFLFHDSVSGCIGAAHAGWRGTALGLPAKTIREMVHLYGAKPENIRIAVGAGIGPCCFETDDDVPDAMVQAFGEGAKMFLSQRDTKWMVDLQGINLWQLREAGIRPENIDACSLCTACHRELYWSHRKMGDQRGVQAALIGLKGVGTE